MAKKEEDFVLKYSDWCDRWPHCSECDYLGCELNVKGPLGFTRKQRKGLIRWFTGESDE